MGLAAARLNLRLFIDGVELPVVGARCTHPDGGPATAEVQVIATDQVWDLPPRSLVTLFYYDSRPYTGDNRGGTLVYYAVGPADPRRWKLLFMGEIAGVVFQKQDSQRSAILHCVDFTSYWDFIQQHYVNFQNGGVELFENAFLGVRMDRIKNFDVLTKDVHSNLLTTLLKSKVKVTKTVNGKETTEEIPSLYLGLHRLIREMFFASNFYYARAFNRLRMNDLIVGLPKDTTSAKLFRLDYFQKFINNQVGGGGGLVTARQMIDFLLKTVFHTVTTIPCPMFDHTGAVRGFDPDANTDTIASEIIDRDAYKGATLNYTMLKPDAWFLVAPACNVIFPHQYNAISYQRNYLAEPTRLFMRTSLFFSGKDKWLTERFYAPDFEVFNDFLHLEGGYLSRMSKILLPHEEQVGINPIMGWQPDIGAYVAKGARREYLSKVADYEFWKARFAQRTLNVSGPFNPEVVPGYPGVVMDRVGSGTEANRHFIGQVATVVHAIDQTGGWTYLTLTAARVHDEDIDFDGAGKSIEEITSRGTDGFLDDRYDMTRVGKDVYGPLFGCGSITDLLVEENLTTELGEVQGGIVLDAIERSGKVVGCVTAIEALYRKVVSSGGDPDTFSWNMSRRLHADITQILGLEGHNASDAEQEAVSAILRDPTWVGAGDPQETQGFMGVAVDPNCSDTANDKYTVKTKESVQVGTKHTDAVMESVTDSSTGDVTDEEVAPATDTPIYKTTYKIDSEASYGLKVHLEERRTTVQAYLDSLQYRGLRG